MRLRLLAYVCEDAGVYPCEDKGYSTFEHLFARRPLKCRYVIAETERGAILSADLFDARHLSGSPNTREMIMGTYRIYETLDAAIAGTLMLYEN